MQWDPQAEKELVEMVPAPFREMAKQKVEEIAKQREKEIVTMDEVSIAKARYMSGTL